MQRKQASGRPDPSLFQKLSTLEWNPIFATCREDVQYSAENEPLIESRDLGEGVVRCFMKGKDESDACLPRADKVEEYCFGATLKELQEGKRDIGGPVG
jgi:hypothetical protein